MTKKETRLVLIGQKNRESSDSKCQNWLLDLVSKILILIYDKYLLEIKLKVRNEFNPNCWIGGF